MCNVPLRLTSGLLLIVTAWLPLPVRAQEAPLVPIHEFSVSAGVSYFDYEEDSIDVKIDGPMYGVAGRYAFHSDTSHWMLGAQAELDCDRAVDGFKLLSRDGSQPFRDPVFGDGSNLVGDGV